MASEKPFGHDGIKFPPAGNFDRAQSVEHNNDFDGMNQIASLVSRGGKTDATSNNQFTDFLNVDV